MPVVNSRPRYQSNKNKLSVHLSNVAARIAICALKMEANLYVLQLRLSNQQSHPFLFDNQSVAVHKAHRRAFFLPKLFVAT
jgi:hypothetical protein